MTCYRSGGCGSYEYRSCSECPASKPEYAKRNAGDSRAPLQYCKECKYGEKGSVGTICRRTNPPTQVFDHGTCGFWEKKDETGSIGDRIRNSSDEELVRIFMEKGEVIQWKLEANSMTCTFFASHKQKEMLLDWIQTVQALGQDAKVVMPGDEDQ